MTVRVDSLSPSQLAAFETLKLQFEHSTFIHFCGSPGTGKTTLLRMLQRDTRAQWIDAKSLVDSVADFHPFAIEEGIAELFTRVLQGTERIIVDDFHLFHSYADGCSSYIRSSYNQVIFKAIINQVQEAKASIVFGSTSYSPSPLSDLSLDVSIGDFQVEDYKHLHLTFGGSPHQSIEWPAIHRFAPNLNCYQMLMLTEWLNKNTNATLKDVQDFIVSQGLGSNVDTNEVQNVNLEDLIGCEHIRKSLEENILLPFENVEIAMELGLAPKRGVILAGPPGTGKTTVGRALAHRMRGKFFLIDGTMISGTDHFYYRIDRVFRQAMENSPSVVFIDDSDVIFESGREHGLYRYLLTMLDGLESASASGVCVMLTAMDLGNIPPALVRSGRIELWLETKLPDDDSREKILVKLFQGKVGISDRAKMKQVVEKSKGMSGADLKRLVLDAKLKLANDRVKQLHEQDFGEYLLAAIDDLSLSQKSYATAVRKAHQVNKDRPRWFNVHPELFESEVAS